MTKTANRVINLSGTYVDFETAVNLMDDNLRGKLHLELAPCGSQKFFTAYELAHKEKFGEDWELSKANPIY